MHSTFLSIASLGRGQVSDGNGKPGMTQGARNIILRWCITLCSVVAVAIGASGKDGTDFLQVPGMYFVTWDAKQAIFPQSIITADMRQKINRARWSKGQHKLPEHLIGWQFDLNKDGVGEVIVETGQWGGESLILRIQDGRAEIIGAFKGSFGLIRREGDWDDIVVFSFSGSHHMAKDGLRFDGKKYSRIWRYEQGDQKSAKE